MLNLVRTLAGLCILLTLATASLTIEPDVPGRLAIRWTRATFWQTYRLQGRYTVWGLSNGVVSTVASPLDGTTTSVVGLAPGLYSVQLEPGACIVSERTVEAPASVPRPDDPEPCERTLPASALVIVEAGQQVEVELSIRAPDHRGADGIAMHH